MNEVFSFGSYYPGDSTLHRLDPRTKLLGGIVFLLIALLARSFVALGAIAVFIAALYGAARIPAGRALRSLAPLLAIVLVVAVLNLLTNHSGRVLAALGPFQISEGSLRSCSFTAARMLLMMCGMSLVTMTTMTLDLTSAVERLLAPFARIGLPAYSNEVILMLKASALASTVTLLELTGMARTIIARTYLPVEIFFAAGVFYLVISFLLVQGFKLLERWLRVDACQGR